MELLLATNFIGYSLFLRYKAQQTRHPILCLASTEGLMNRKIFLFIAIQHCSEIYCRVDSLCLLAYLNSYSFTFFIFWPIEDPESED